MMKIVRWTQFFLLLPGLTSFAQEKNNVPAQQPITVIRAGTLIDGKSDKPRRDQIIVVRGNLVETVSDAASARIPPDRLIIASPFLLPFENLISDRRYASR